MRLVPSRYPRVRAAGLGAAAYLVGYLLTYGWLGGLAASTGAGIHATVRYGPGDSGPVGRPSVVTLLGGGTATDWAGWLFYSAHLVPFSIDVPDLPPAGSASVPNLVLAAESPTVLLLFVVPPLLLGVAGAVAAREAPAVGDGVLPAGARRGMTVALGYLPLTVAGAFVFAVSPTIWRGGSVAPSLLGSVLLMGLLYPIVFGGLGGMLSIRFRSSRPGV